VASRSLNDLRPEIRHIVDGFLDACAGAGIDVLVTCTLRSNEEQAALYAKGRTEPGHRVTNAPPGRSAHNHGLAIDVVPMVNGKPDWNGYDPVWETIGKLGETAGLVWLGAPNSPFPEKPHFELADWQQVAGI